MNKKDKDKILNSNLSTLVKRFSHTDVISSLHRQYSENDSGHLLLSLIDDNEIIGKARINENILNEEIKNMQIRGVNYPLFVHQKENGRYEIIYNRVKYVAAKKLNLEYVPYTLIKLPEVDELLFLAGLLRDSRDSSIIEMSLLLNYLSKNYSFTQKDIASLLNQSRSQITNIIRIAKLPDDVLFDLSQGKLSFGHVRALNGLKDEDIKNLVKKIYDDNLSVREVENMVKNLNNKNQYFSDEQFLSNKYKAKFIIHRNKIEISFENSEEKDDFISEIKK